MYSFPARNVTGRNPFGSGDKAEILYAKGSNIYYDAETEKAATGIRPLERGDNRQLLDEALRIAARADVIVAALGECAE